MSVIESKLSGGGDQSQARNDDAFCYRARGVYFEGSNVILRIAGIIWLYGFFALALYAVADTIFGAGSTSWRVTNFLPRLVIYAMWPLAAMTPRGRYLLFRRWRDPQ